jgi:hypothetical protein
MGRHRPSASRAPRRLSRPQPYAPPPQRSAAAPSGFPPGVPALTAHPRRLRGPGRSPQSRSHAQAKHIRLPVALELADLFDRDACVSRANPFPSGGLGMVRELAEPGRSWRRAQPWLCISNSGPSVPADESRQSADAPGSRVRGRMGATAEPYVKEQSERDFPLGDDSALLQCRSWPPRPAVSKPGDRLARRPASRLECGLARLGYGGC